MKTQNTLRLQFMRLCIAISVIESWQKIEEEHIFLLIQEKWPCTFYSSHCSQNFKCLTRLVLKMEATQCFFFYQTPSHPISCRAAISYLNLARTAYRRSKRDHFMY